MSGTLVQIEQEALSLPAEERARLADRLWESVLGDRPVEVVMTPGLERLLDEGLERVSEAKSTDELRRGE